MKQNIIWIFGDQHRAQALGYMGDPNARTPNIDRMADEGVTFTDAVAGCAADEPVHPQRRAEDSAKMRS